MKTSRTIRTRAAIVAALCLTAAGLAVTNPAQAADPTPLVIVGTSDVSDSNLMAAVIEPGFEAAHPEYDLQYVPKGTGAAIAFAEAGSASALLVHAAALENQFVAGGFSSEKYGRAIFWGDYVLLGPASDPAGVMSGADPSTDIVTAFEKIAAAGAANTATFVSRGGTPGTTVQEHAIWKLTNDTVAKCDVSQGDGLGQSPSTASGACGTPVGNLPTWYKATGLNQGLNVKAGDACSGSSFPNGGCYVFTDRGTFSYLNSTGALANLKIVTRDNAAEARGGSTLLVNSFHAYGINPAAVGTDLNTAGAKAFLDWLTSPAGQTAVALHLNADGDPAFIPSASPLITIDSQPSKVIAGKSLTITGHLTNAVPGTPALDNVPVTLRNPALATVATAKTNASGAFTLKYRPPVGQTYTVTTSAIEKIEDASLNPVFGDLLAPASAGISKIKVSGSYVGITKTAKSGTKGIRVFGVVLPRVTSGGAVLRMYAGHPGKPLKLIEAQPLAVGATTFNKRFVLGQGTWRYQLQYAHPGVIAVPDRTDSIRQVRLP